MRHFLLLAVTFLCFTTMSAQTVSSLCGGTLGYQDGTGTAARFYRPTDICVDASGILYVVDRDNYKVRKITPQGDVSTLAGSSQGYVDARGSEAKFSSLTGICVDAAGNVYVSEYARVRKITAAGVVTTVAGSSDNDTGYVEGNGTSARFFSTTGICVDVSGNLYVADNQSKIRKITPNGDVSTYYNGSSVFISTGGICINNATGELYMTDRYGQKIYKILTNGTISLFAGSNTMGYVNGLGSSAQFNFPERICCDASGNLYVTDNMYLIRKISPSHVVSTFAGAEGGNVDGNVSIARFGNLDGICVNTQGIVYTSDYQNIKIKKITPQGLGINDNVLSKSIKIYPNPAKEVLNIDMDSFTENTLVTISDVSGKTVHSEKSKGLKTTVNISSFSKGIYFATVTKDSQSATFKFIVE